MCQGRGGYKDVQDEGNQSSQSFQWFGSGDGNGKQTQAPSDTRRSIRAVPRSVLVSDMGDGSLLLEGWRDGPNAYLSPADAVPFRRLLAAAFGSTELAHRHSRGESR